MTPLSSADGWSRVGGRRTSFVATHGEVRELLLALPDEQGPWGFTGTDLVRDAEGSEKRQPFVCDGADLDRCLGPDGARPELLAWSPALTPDLPPPTAPHYLTLCAWSGFIGVQRFGVQHSDGCEVSLYFVDRIRRNDGTEERDYADYRRVFERLRRKVRASLVADTMRQPPVGRPHADDTTRWTQAAVAAQAADGDFPLRPWLPDQE